MDIDFSILPVTHQSKRVGPGTIFVAIKGMRDDGARYIPEALARGATEIVVAQGVQLDPVIAHLCAISQVPIHYVSQPRATLAALSAALHGYPAQKLRFIGVTGTKGKTTTSFLLFHILRVAGKRAALLSTVENRILSTTYETELTTQHPDYLHAFFNRCVQEGVAWVVLEAAAQAFSLHRLDGILFERAVWLNFSQEHGEFYASLDEYWHAKTQLFTQVVPGGIAVLPRLEERIRTIPLRTDIQRLCYAPDEEIQEPCAVTSPCVSCMYESHIYRCAQLMGEHNTHNVCAAVATARSLGITPQVIQQALATFPGVPGRLNWHHLPRGVIACIDYAHNPASFQATLGLLRRCTKQLIVLFGAGGEREPARRPLMGRCAAEYADAIYLTTDNPRSEDPAAICQDILSGIPAEHLHKVVIDLDRENAIKRAVAQAAPGAVVALLGKGPEEYQLIGSIKHPFSERAILRGLPLL